MGEAVERGDPPAWELLESEPLGDFEMFRVRRDRVRSPRDGSEHDFHVVEAADGVAVVALTPAGELVMVKQYRNPLRRVTLELPSGVVDPGEPPERAAARELREETGYEGGPPERLGEIVLNPSWQVTRVHVLAVRGARPTAEKEPDEGEDTRVCLLPLAEAPGRVVSGEITASVAVSALALFAWARGEGTSGGAAG